MEKLWVRDATHRIKSPRGKAEGQQQMHCWRDLRGSV